MFNYKTLKQNIPFCSRTKLYALVSSWTIYNLALILDFESCSFGLEMSVPLLWVVTTNTGISNRLGFSESIREGGRFPDSRSIAGAPCKGFDGKLKGKKPKWSSCSLNTDFKYSCLGGSENTGNFPVFSNLVANPAGEIAILSEQKVSDVVLKQAALVKKYLPSNQALDVKADMVVSGTLSLLNEAYDRCGEVCAEYAKTFYLG